MFTRKKLEEVLVNEFDISREIIRNLDNDTDLLEAELLDSFDFLKFLMILGEISGNDIDFSLTPPDSLTSFTNLMSISFDDVG